MASKHRSHRWFRSVVSLAALSCLLYLGAVAALWWDQEGVLFHPVPLPPDHRFEFGDDVQETWIDVPGARLNALHLRLPDPDGVVVFLHGNSGNLQTWFTAAPAFRKANFDLFMPDYRGFGKSTGQIENQAQLEADVRAVWEAVTPLYRGRLLVVYGRSLGTGLAVILAADVQPDLTILVSPYRSMEAMAAEHYPWFPTAVLRYPLRTEESLARVKTPVLVFLGDRDTLIPPAQSEHLAMDNPNVTLIRVTGAGHDDLHRFPAYLDGLSDALSQWDGG